MRTTASHYWTLVDEYKLHVPERSHLNGCKPEPLPYYLLGNDIFHLKMW